MAMRKVITGLRGICFANAVSQATKDSCRLYKQNYIRHLRCCARKMASSGKKDHIDITKDNSRHEVISQAKVIEISNISNTVKMLRIQVADKRFTFKAGQWVDMMIPGVDKVGGYSMTSAPDLLTSNGELHLAVKYAKYPPAYWIHTKCKRGDLVDVRAGGDFFYDPSGNDKKMDVLLLAGGVGINPLYSIMQHFKCIHPVLSKEGSVERPVKLSLLFSASSEEELIFKEELMKTSNTNDHIQIKLFSSREQAKTQGIVSGRRIGPSDVAEVFKFLDKTQTLAYLCGPGSFIKAMESHCLDCGIDQNRILYETWW